jgi:hypothetical protein
MYICRTRMWFLRAFHASLLTYGAESFLSRQLCSPSRTSQHFTEPEGSIPCSQEPSTGPYPEPYPSNPLHSMPSYLSKIHFNIVHSSTYWSCQWSLSFWLSHQYPTYIPLPPHSCHMPRPSHPSWLEYSHYTWRRVRVIFHASYRSVFFNLSAPAAHPNLPDKLTAYHKISTHEKGV